MENLSRRSLTVGDSEKWLNVVITNVTTSGGIKEIGVGLDVGSTYNRLRIFDDEEGEISDNYEVNSDIVMVDDISTIKSSTPSLYSNIELIVKDITDASEKPSKIFDTEHFVKCELADGKAGAALERSGIISKTKNKSTYLNAISIIALKMLTEDFESLADEYKVTLATSLPPEDFKSLAVLDNYKNLMAGKYEVTFVRLGISFIINIIKNEIYLEKEPNAVQYALAYDDESLLEKTSIMVDGGGKSTDKSFMKEGRILEEYSSTSGNAGNRLIKQIAEMYMQETGKSEPPKEAIITALKTGTLVRGITEFDIFNIIDTCKSAMAETIFNEIISMLDSAATSLDDVENITFHGRLFSDTKTSDGRVSNIADKIFARVSELTEMKCDKVTTTDCITQGVILSRWVELSA